MKLDAESQRLLKLSEATVYMLPYALGDDKLLRLKKTAAVLQTPEKVAAWLNFAATDCFARTGLPHCLLECEVRRWMQQIDLLAL